MSGRKYKIISCIALAMAVIGSVWSVTGVSARRPAVDHKVYIAFGFHVNLYHSFRNDTNDDHGYGQDIKVIRQTIDTLNRFNARGVPVKAVWDFDNLFSLQERLPRHAPDIIEDIRHRVQHRGDEVILMSYNNGLASAMTHQELTDAMRWAVSNPWGSGVKDIFGRYSPIVRPQEMMTTPGNFAIYREQGIEAVSLYYSATPFDAFRVFSRPLSRTEAYNPVIYKNPQTSEEMTIIPTYHIGDLMENISLRHWVDELHGLQKSGEIDDDVLIFINYDADSLFWSGLNLPWPLNQLPNTGGLAALVDEVKDLEHLRFTTLEGYLKDHPPVGTIFFGQDTADGSFDGYNSWAEKAQAHQYWTRIEHHRRLEQMARKALALMDDATLDEKVRPLLNKVYLKRMRALSTTHFGMATPFLVPDRERSVSLLLEEMDHYARRIETLIRSGAGKHYPYALSPASLPEGHQWVDTLLLTGLNRTATHSSGRFLNLKVPDQNGVGPVALMKPDGRMFPARIIHRRPSNADAGTHIKVYFPNGGDLDDGFYYLLRPPKVPAAEESGPSASRHLDNGRVSLRLGPNGKPSGLFIDGIQKLEPGSLMPYIRYRDRIDQPARLQVTPLASEQGVRSVQVLGTWKGPEHHTLAAGAVDYHFSLVDELPYLFIDGRVKMPLTAERDLLKADTPALARRADLGWREVAPMELRFSHRATIDDPIRILKQNFLDITSSYAVDYFQHSADNLSLDNINNHITAAYVGIVAGGQGVAVGMDTHLQANFAFAPVKVRYCDEQSTFSTRVNPFGTYHGRQYRHPTWGNRQGYEMTVLAGEQFHSAGPTYNGESTDFGAMLAFFDGDAMDARVRDDLIHFARPPMVLSLIHADENSVGADGGGSEKSSEIAFRTGAQKRFAHPPRLSWNFKIKVVWANIHAYLKRYAI